MTDLFSKTNAPYFIAGTLTLFTFGVFAIATYVSFLSPIAALGIILPVILSFSVLAVYKIISKKMEAERSSFIEKEQELKEQLESKVQELESKITLEKGAASREVEELRNQLDKVEIHRLKNQIDILNDEKEELRIANMELEEKIKGQLKHKEEMLSREHQELHSKNTKLSEKVNSLKEGLSQSQSENELNSLRLKLEYEDKLRLELKHTGKLSSELELRVKEIFSLKVQLAILGKKMEILKEEEKLARDFISGGGALAEERNLAEKLNQEKDKSKELKRELQELKTELDSQIDKNSSLIEEREKYLSEISKLRKEVSSLKNELKDGLKEEELLRKTIDVKVQHLTDVERQLDVCRDKINEVQDKMLEAVRKTFESMLIEQGQGSTQEAIQGAVDLFMGKVNDNLYMASTPEFGKVDENKHASKQFQKPKSLTPKEIEKPFEEFFDISISSITESIEVNTIKGIQKLQNKQKFPEKRKKRSFKKKNKENLGQQSPNTSTDSVNLLTLGDTTNIALTQI